MMQGDEPAAESIFGGMVHPTHAEESVMQLQLNLDRLMLGYVMSAALFCIALALAAKDMHSTSGLEDTGWAGLATIVIPLGMSFVTFLITEVIQQLASREK